MVIHWLIPLGLRAVEEQLQSEVIRIAGDRYSHTHPEVKRWDCNVGSIFLGDQKVSIRVPRVRDVLNGPGSVTVIILSRPARSTEG